jgi:hypothetical protein
VCADIGQGYICIRNCGSGLVGDRTLNAGATASLGPCLWEQSEGKNEERKEKTAQAAYPIELHGIGLAIGSRVIGYFHVLEKNVYSRHWTI